MKQFIIFATNGDGSERIEHECDTIEEVARYLDDRPHLSGRVVDRDTFVRDLKDAVA